MDGACVIQGCTLLEIDVSKGGVTPGYGFEVDPELVAYWYLACSF